MTKNKKELVVMGKKKIPTDKEIRTIQGANRDALLIKLGSTSEKEAQKRWPVRSEPISGNINWIKKELHKNLDKCNTEDSICIFRVLLPVNKEYDYIFRSKKDKDGKKLTVPKIREMRENALEQFYQLIQKIQDEK